MWYKVKKIYVGTQQVRPNYIVCDFTQSDCGFTLYDKHTNVSNGRDSNWLYWKNTGTTAQWIAWKIPQNIYSRQVKKIYIEMKSDTTRFWWWISYNIDTYYSRAWRNEIQNNRTGTATATGIWNTPSNTLFTLTIDLENKQLIYAAWSSYTKSLTDTEISNIISYWNWWNMNICWMMDSFNQNKYIYIQKAIFYY